MFRGLARTRRVLNSMSTVSGSATPILGSGITAVFSRAARVLKCSRAQSVSTSTTVSSTPLFKVM
jgi:hypothetical protein